MDDIERVYMEVWTATMKLDNDNAVELVRNSLTLRFKISSTTENVNTWRRKTFVQEKTM